MALAVFLYGHGIQAPGALGQRLIDDSFYLCLNGTRETLPFGLPASDWFVRGSKIIDTRLVHAAADEPEFQAGDEVPIAARSIVVFRHLE